MSNNALIHWVNKTVVSSVYSDKANIQTMSVLTLTVPTSNIRWLSTPNIFVML